VVSVTPQLRFTPGTHWIGGWVGPRAGLDAGARRKILCPSGIEPRSSSPWSDTILPELLRLLCILISATYLTLDHQLSDFNKSEIGMCNRWERQYTSTQNSKIILTFIILDMSQIRPKILNQQRCNFIKYLGIKYSNYSPFFSDGQYFSQNTFHVLTWWCSHMHALNTNLSAKYSKNPQKVCQDIFGKMDI
jgi:hypothetical protein